jgi:DNA-binding response OmpR family regulator
MEKHAVLLVDDEAGTVEAVKAGLEARGYAVLGATSAAEGLELLRTVVPDIVVADLRMSPVNGFEFFQAIKKLPALRMTPVVFFTAVEDALARKYSDLLGADAYVTKPVDMELLDETIKRHLSPRTPA